MIVCLFWLVQYIWQFLFFWALFQVQDYDSLFAFMEQMHQYESSILVKMAYTFITMPAVSLNSVLHSIVSAITLWDLFFIGISILWFLQANKKKAGIFLGLNVAMLAMIFFFLMMGMQVSSISSLITLLHTLSILCLLIHSGFIGVLLFIFVQHIVKNTINT